MNTGAENQRTTAVLAPSVALERLEQKMRRAAPQGVMIYADEVGVWADELATLRASLAQQGEAKPFAWFTDDYRDDKSATTYDPVVAERWRNKGWPVSPLFPHPAAVDAASVERLAKFITIQESRNCKTLDDAMFHQSNWRRAIPEAREMLTAALQPAATSEGENNG